MDLDITIENNISLYRLFEKKEKFPFFIVRMPYLSSNIPSSIFYGLIFSEFLLIASCTLRLADFVLKPSQLYTGMVTQVGNKASALRQIKKSIPKIPWNIFRVFQGIWRNNQRNKYVLTSKLQLGWQKLCICMYMCICICLYMYVYTCISIDIYHVCEKSFFCIRM